MRLCEARAALLRRRRGDARDGAAKLGPHWHARVQDRAARLRLRALGVLTGYSECSRGVFRVRSTRKGTHRPHAGVLCNGTHTVWHDARLNRRGTRAPVRGPWRSPGPGGPVRGPWRSDSDGARPARSESAPAGHGDRGPGGLTRFLFPLSAGPDSRRFDGPGTFERSSLLRLKRPGGRNARRS